MTRDYKQTFVAQQEPQPQQAVVVAVDGLGRIVTIANVLITIVLISGIFFDNGSATVAVLSGICYFSLSTTMALLTLSGTLTHIVTNGQREKTIRRRDEQMYSLQAAQLQVSLVPPVRIPSARPAQPLALPQAPNYVPAVPPADERLKLASYQFVRALFDEEGKPLPKRILAEHTKSPGLVQHEKPKPDVVGYLTGLQMVWTNERKQLFFNVRDFPTLRFCITAIKLGYPAGREATPPSNSPHPSPQLHEYEGEGGQ